MIANIEKELLQMEQHNPAPSVANNAGNDKVRKLESLVNTLQCVIDEIRKTADVLAITYCNLTPKLEVQVRLREFANDLPVERLKRLTRISPEHCYPWEVSCQIGPAQFCAVAKADELSKLHIPDECIVKISEGGEYCGSTSA